MLLLLLWILQLLYRLLLLSIELNDKKKPRKKLRNQDFTDVDVVDIDVVRVALDVDGGMTVASNVEVVVVIAVDAISIELKENQR